MRVTHRHGPVRLVASPAALRAQALVIVAMLQIGVAAALSSPAHPAVVADPVVAVSVPTAPAPSAPKPKPAPAPAKPRPVTKPAARTPAVKAARQTRRYVPTGTGMWTYQWSETEGGSATKVVARAKANGLTHIYVRTGTRKGGFDGAPVLKKLLPATKGTGIKVIAWDFPTLANPAADAKRLAAAAKYHVKGAPRVAAVAPDIETGSEGTTLTGARVTQYMKTLRRLLPKDVSIIGVVPWPSEKRVGRYPYAKVAAYSDVLAPMDYWVNRDPAVVAAQSIKRLRVFRKPIAPIGQAYDPRIDVPTLPWGSPSQDDVAKFLKTAKQYGAAGASLWVWQFASRAHWHALSAARVLYRP